MRSRRIGQPGAQFTAVWEFRVEPRKRSAFERAYGPNGDWAKLFRRAKGYIRTELIRDPETPGRYITLDFWTSRLAYQRFKTRNVAAYKSLDKCCQALTFGERLIGEFEKAVLPSLLRAYQERASIRRATGTDVPAMISIERDAPSAAHWNEASYQAIFNPAAPRRIALVSELHGSVLGFVVARINGEECDLENVVVAEAARHKGIGRQLMEALRTEVQKQNVYRINLEVRPSNTAARALYDKCGFEVSGRRGSYYSDPLEDALVYTMTAS